jgi:hypothetical protein
MPNPVFLFFLVAYNFFKGADMLFEGVPAFAGGYYESPGLAGNPRCLEKVSALGIPLNHHGSSLGFVLVYRASIRPFSREEMKGLEQISQGLSRSIFSCRALVNTA